MALNDNFIQQQQQHILCVCMYAADLPEGTVRKIQFDSNFTYAVCELRRRKETFQWKYRKKSLLRLLSTHHLDTYRAIFFCSHSFGKGSELCKCGWKIQFLNKFLSLLPFLFLSNIFIHSTQNKYCGKEFFILEMDLKFRQENKI